MIGFKTIRKGERVAVWDLGGQVKIVDGAKRMLVTTQSLEPLKRFAAEPDGYLIVAFKDGRRQHMRGPASYGSIR